MYTFIRFLVCTLIPFAVISCKRDTITYYTTGITLLNYNNAGVYLQEATGSSVNDSSYVIRINYKSDQTAYYAVNDEYTYHPGNKPVSIAVLSLQNFDSLHPAGSLLNDYFINGPGIESTIERVVYDFPDTKDFYPTHDPDDLWLMVPPSAPGFYQFVVQMTFDNGMTFRDTTTAITFVP